MQLPERNGAQRQRAAVEQGMSIEEAYAVEVAVTQHSYANEGVATEAQEPGEDEMRAALEEQMRRITVQDVLVQTVVTLINLGGRRLGLAASRSRRATSTSSRRGLRSRARGRSCR